MKLTDNNIKTIKYEKRMGFVLPSMLIVLAIFYNFFYLISPDSKNWILLVLVNSVLIGVSIVLSHFMNLKYNRDLKDGTKKITINKIHRKEDQTSYEAGSAALYIPILGDLFPKLWGHREMKAIYKTNLIINKHRHRVEKEFYDTLKAGDYVEMHYSIYSETLLEIKTNQRKN